MNNYKKVLFASLGGAFEYYDFAIYAIFASVIGSRFFDFSNSVTNTLMVFLVFAGSYFVKPFGAIFFGYFGDKYSRIAVLRVTIILLFISTLGMALLPSVNEIGVWATVFFVVFRCIQGIAIGAEIPIAVTYSTESFPNRQGLVTGIVFSCLSLGIMMTTLVFFIMTKFTSSEFVAEYGWRIAFLLGAVFTFFIYFLRKGVTDSYDFLVDKSSEVKEEIGVFLKRIFIGIALVSSVAMMMTQLYMFLPAFYKEYVNASVDISELLLIGSIVMTVSCIIGGFISDYVSKKKMMALLLIITLAIVPIFYKNLLEANNVFGPFIAISIILGFIAPTYNVIIVNMFKPSYKCRGLGISYNFGYLIFSSPIPLVSMLLINMTGSIFIPMLLIVATIVISMFGLVVSRKAAI
ncbi:MFS transporter [Pseudofrancisella aestuarii]|uniref:MFS transporter n=1 Tax=Pseudofrancisella aestuarii TaxID=2670347 RepID=A0ABV9TAJ0_9GAMM|nr:MFS transporter [Pseudofrancisella aestuarii]